MSQRVPGSWKVRTVSRRKELLKRYHAHLSKRTDPKCWCTERLPLREFLCKRQRNRQRPWLPIFRESFIGASHRQSVIPQIDILPAQAEHLTSPQSKPHGERYTDEQTVVELGRLFGLRSLFRHMKESLRFLCGQSVGAVLPSRQRNLGHRRLRDQFLRNRPGKRRPKGSQTRPYRIGLVLLAQLVACCFNVYAPQLLQRNFPNDRKERTEPYLGRIPICLWVFYTRMGGR